MKPSEFIKEKENKNYTQMKYKKFLEELNKKFIDKAEYDKLKKRFSELDDILTDDVEKLKNSIPKAEVLKIIDEYVNDDDMSIEELKKRIEK